MMQQGQVNQFFFLARERQNIYLKKISKAPKPWTEDPIFNHYKFTNVFREQDRTTTWFREYVRGPLAESPDVLLATVVFRFFNRIETAQVIFQDREADDHTPWSFFLANGDGKELERSIRYRLPKGPFVTGAYFITSPKGLDKLAGICNVLETFYHHPGFPLVKGGDLVDWRVMAELLHGDDLLGLEDVWNWLRKFPFNGNFHAHEMVTDLRFTKLLRNAHDINTWSNPGPGCQRGLARIAGRDYTTLVPVPQAIDEMIQLLELSRLGHFWPPEWQPWELHQVEMWCCEFDKHERIRLGQGTTRSIYRG